MSLRIRCTSCGHEMLVPGLRSGTNLNCPQCNTLFTVPIVLDVEREAVDVGVTCVHCKHQNAPGTTTCRQCGADLVTGKRAPLGRRLSLWIERRWPFVTAGAVIIFAGVFVLVRVVSDLPVVIESEEKDPNLAQPTVTMGATLAAALFAADDPNTQAAAFQSVLSHGPAVQEFLSRELQAYANDEERTAHGDRAADMTIEVFVTFNQPDELMLAALKQAAVLDELRNVALLARGSFGDATAAEELTAWWLSLLERELFLNAMLDGDMGAPADLVTALSETRDQRRQVTQALRRLVQEDVLGVLGPVARRYWNSWRWLGQTRGEAFADALFELAMPYRGRLSVLAADEEEAKEAIRAARRTLSMLGEQGQPLAAAAAGVAMVQNAPQYESARDRIVNALLEQMSDLRARDQQRVIWALARLTGRLFGSYGSQQPPWEVTPAIGAEVVQWAEQEHGIAVTLADDSPWMRPVTLEYEVAVATADPNAVEGME